MPKKKQKLVVPDDKKAQVVAALRRMVKAQVELWDAGREVELVLEIEFSTRGETFESLAVACDSPDDALTLNEADLLAALEDSLE